MMTKAVSFHIYDPELWEEFKAFVMMKWGKLHTALSLEIAAALREYLDRHSKTLQTKTVRKKQYKEGIRQESPEDEGQNFPSFIIALPQNAVIRKLIHIVKQIGPDTYEVPEHFIDNIIMTCAGSSTRTINEYKSLLERFGVLESNRTADDSKKKIYRVNQQAIEAILDGSLFIRMRQSCYYRKTNEGSKTFSTPQEYPRKDKVSTTTTPPAPDTDTINQQ